MELLLWRHADAEDGTDHTARRLTVTPITEKSLAPGANARAEWRIEKGAPL